jgi:hypothetical protein
MTILFSLVCGSVCAVLCGVIGGFEGHVHPDMLGPEIDYDDDDYDVNTTTGDTP